MKNEILYKGVSIDASFKMIRMRLETVEYYKLELENRRVSPKESLENNICEINEEIDAGLEHIRQCYRKEWLDAWDGQLFSK
jgi:hypothetical protein